MQPLHGAGKTSFWLLLEELTGFRGRRMWDASRPEGEFRRWMGVSKATEKLGFQAEMNLAEGLSRTVEWFRRHGPTVADSRRR